MLLEIMRFTRRCPLQAEVMVTCSKGLNPVKASNRTLNVMQPSLIELTLDLQ